ncbi:hypothetical protein ACOMHN_019590 [Nucella lapillus]
MRTAVLPGVALDLWWRKVSSNVNIRRTLKRHLLVICLILALALGVLLGCILRLRRRRYSAKELEYLRFPGETLLSMLDLLVLPLVVSSIISGLTLMESWAVGRMGLRAAGYYLGTYVLSVTAGALLAWIILPKKVVKDGGERQSMFQSFGPADPILDLFRSRHLDPKQDRWRYPQYSTPEGKDEKDDLQRLTDSLSAATKHFGLTISIKKTEVMFQPSKGSTANTPEIKIDVKVLNNVDSFTYLGSSLTFSNSLDKEISTRIAKANASYGRLHKRVWNERGLKLETKCAVYRAVVLTALLYGCESWAIYHRHVKLLDQFHQCCLRRILNIKWYHRVSNLKVLLQAQMPSIDAPLTQSQLRWSGHLVRMQDSRLPKQLFYGKLTEGLPPRGQPKLRYKDTLKKIPADMRH